MIYVVSKESGRWCVNGEGRDVATGDRIGFLEIADATYFVAAGRAVFGADEAASEPAVEGEPAPEPKRKKAKA